MPNLKYQIPLELAQAIEPKIAEHLDIIYHVKNDQCYYNLRCKFGAESFRFVVYNQHQAHGRQIRSDEFIFEYSPSSKAKATGTKSQGKFGIIMDHLNLWLRLVKEYKDLPSVHDDPIIENYIKEFEGKFKFSEDAQQNEPFTFEQQIWLEAYLAKTRELIEELCATAIPEEKPEYKALANSTKEIEKIITTGTKKEIQTKLISFWARSRKLSLELIKGILIELGGELAKKLLL